MLSEHVDALMLQRVKVLHIRTEIAGLRLNRQLIPWQRFDRVVTGPVVIGLGPSPGLVLYHQLTELPNPIAFVSEKPGQWLAEFRRYEIPVQDPAELSAVYHDTGERLFKYLLLGIAIFGLGTLMLGLGFLGAFDFWGDFFGRFIH